MRPSGKAAAAARRLVLWIVALLAVVLLTALNTWLLGWPTLALLAILWGALMVAFTLYFFRDPEPRVPQEPGLIVAPAHGTVDIIDEIAEPDAVGGPCRRISIFLSVFDVHVQNAPTAGRVAFFRHNPGRFLNAMRSESATQNENVLLGLEPRERPGAKVGVRMIPGLIARRILTWVAAGDEVARGDRLGLIQFGSRVELYLPLSTQIKTRLGDKVVGGETVVAAFEQ